MASFESTSEDEYIPDTDNFERWHSEILQTLARGIVPTDDTLTGYFEAMIGYSKSATKQSADPLTEALDNLALYACSGLGPQVYVTCPSFLALFEGAPTLVTGTFPAGVAVDDVLTQAPLGRLVPASLGQLVSRFKLLQILIRTRQLTCVALPSNFVWRLCTWSTRPIYGEAAMCALMELQSQTDLFPLIEGDMLTLMQWCMTQPATALQVKLFVRHQKFHAPSSVKYLEFLSRAGTQGSEDWCVRALEKIHPVLQRCKALVPPLYLTLQPYPTGERPRYVHVVQYADLLEYLTKKIPDSLVGKSPDLTVARILALEATHVCHKTVLQLSIRFVTFLPRRLRPIHDAFQLLAFGNDLTLQTLALEFMNRVLCAAEVDLRSPLVPLANALRGLSFQTLTELHRVAIPDMLTLAGRLVSEQLFDGPPVDLKRHPGTLHLVVARGDIFGPPMNTSRRDEKIFFRLLETTYEFQVKCGRTTHYHVFGSPLMPVQEFINRLPLACHSARCSIPSDTLVGDLFNLGFRDAPPWGRTSARIEVEMHLGQAHIGNEILETLELSRIAPRKIDWHAEVSLAMPIEYELESPDDGISMQMLQLLSNPFIGLFTGAYLPVISYPGVFTAEVRLIVAMMRPIDQIWRLEVWRNCFNPAPILGDDGQCSHHANEVACLVAIMTGVARDLLGGEFTRKLGKLVAQIFVHGCGVSSRIPLTPEIIGAESFRKGFLSVFPVVPLFGLFTPNELVDVLRLAMSWYPGRMI